MTGSLPADMTHWFVPTPEEFTRKNAVLAARRTLMRPADPEQAAEILRSFVKVGVQGFTFNNPNLTTPELLAVAGRVKRMLA